MIESFLKSIALHLVKKKITDAGKWECSKCGVMKTSRAVIHPGNICTKCANRPK